LKQRSLRKVSRKKRRHTTAKQAEQAAASPRSLYPRMVATLVALLGLFDALYLALSRFFPATPLVCPTGGGCAMVQESPWSTFPPGDGVPVAFIGVAGYAVLFVLGMVALQTDRLGRVALPPLLLGISSAGVLFSIYLVALQFFIIQAICFWCTLSALLQLLIWLAAFFDWRAWRR
jgi:uncharacterized membrane protein